MFERGEHPFLLVPVCSSLLVPMCTWPATGRHLEALAYGSLAISLQPASIPVGGTLFPMHQAWGASTPARSFQSAIPGP